jgi:vancomycin resistance protein YoaR
VLVGVALAALAGVVLGAWWGDQRLHAAEPLRNVSLAGRLVGGIAPDELDAVIAAETERIGSSTVSVDMGDQAIDFLARELGISVDAAATRDAVLDKGRTGPIIERIQGWASSFDGRRPVELRFSFDPEAAVAALRDHPLMLDRVPVHPSATFDGERLVPVEGAPGRGLDVAAIISAIDTAVEQGTFEQVPGAWKEIPSPIPFADATSLVAGVDNRAGAGIVIRLGETMRWIPPKVLYSWLTSESDGGELRLELDGLAALEYIESLYADVWLGGFNPTFEVVDGNPVVADVVDTRTLCCSADAVRAIEEVITGEATQPIDLPLRGPTEDESLAVARDLGVLELVSEFTTEHACCASRVTNIHRIADIIRGYVIPPDGQLSINDYVGRRTRENGFVAAGVIQSGRFDDAVGGGISQFATTIFNAAFFAGLDIPEYQSHSIYISRYPYGREATVSFPAPDLVIHNTTPHHVLIWTSYTDTSITVQMFSTPHVQVEETGQTVGRAGACTRVTTYRQRSYLDGTVVDDSVFATYRPGEGLDCQGRPTARP